jgi:hypothetical protein
MPLALVYVLGAICTSSVGSLTCHKFFGRSKGGSQEKKQQQDSNTAQSEREEHPQHPCEAARASEPPSKELLERSDFESTDDESPEYELWVETELDAEWCIDGDSEHNWRQKCQTATLTRRWEDFEALGKSTGPTLTLPEALKILGIFEASDKSIASAFRRRSRECHPDRRGSNEEFNDLVVAYKTALKAWNLSA